MKIPNFFFLIGMAFLVLNPPLGWATERQLLDQVVAVVNDEAITQSELDVVLKPLYEEYRKHYMGESLMKALNEARQKILSQLIEDRLVFQQAKTQGIHPPDSEIEEKLTDFKTRFKDSQEMDSVLQAEGLSLTDVRKRIERQAMIRELQDMEIRSKIVISPTDVEAYYRDHPEEFTSPERLRFRTLTVKKNEEARTKGITDESARTKIEELRRWILSGDDFGTLAEKNSEDSSARQKGLGDWVEPGSMIPDINDVVFSLPVGEVSRVIETPMGYHLFRVEEKEEAHSKTLDQAREEIFAKLYKEKVRNRFQSWMEDLKREAYISIR